jgi:hypothetical protein
MSINLFQKFAYFRFARQGPACGQTDVQYEARQFWKPRLHFKSFPCSSHLIRFLIVSVQRKRLFHSKSPCATSDGSQPMNLGCFTARSIRNSQISSELQFSCHCELCGAGLLHFPMPAEFLEIYSSNDVKSENFQGYPSRWNEIRTKFVQGILPIILNLMASGMI